MEVWRLAADLAEAEGYAVYASDGRKVGRLEHVRYQRYADHPDTIVIKRRVLLRTRRGQVPFEAIKSVDARGRSIVLNLPSDSIQGAPVTP
jgi:hypothetical protein